MQLIRFVVGPRDMLPLIFQQFSAKINQLNYPKTANLVDLTNQFAHEQSIEPADNRNSIRHELPIF